MKNKYYFFLAAACMFLGCEPKDNNPPLAEPDTESIEQIILNPHEVTLYVGDTITLDISIYPESLQNQANILWESTDTTIAKVTNGIITALSPGECYVIARAEVRDYCRVIVAEKISPTPPKFSFSNLTNEDSLLVVEEVSANNYIVRGVPKGRRFSGFVTCEAMGYLYTFGLTWTRSSINFSQVQVYDYSAYSVTDTYENYQYGAIQFAYSDKCYSSKIYFVGSVPYSSNNASAVFSASSRNGTSTSITVRFVE